MQTGILRAVIEGQSGGGAQIFGPTRLGTPLDPFSRASAVQIMTLALRPGTLFQQGENSGTDALAWGKAWGTT